MCVWGGEAGAVGRLQVEGKNVYVWVYRKREAGTLDIHMIRLSNKYNAVAHEAVSNRRWSVGAVLAESNARATCLAIHFRPI